MRNTPLEFMRELAEENMRFWQQTLNQPGQMNESEEADSSLAYDNLTMDVALAAKLQQAIREDQLALYYQPQVNLEENSINGAEALLRWPNADFKNISIEKLIILAEHTGIINELTLWVVEQACKDIAKLASDDISNHSISINLSAKNLAITNLTEKVENILIKYQVAKF